MTLSAEPKIDATINFFVKTATQQDMEKNWPYDPKTDLNQLPTDNESAKTIQNGESVKCSSGFIKDHVNNKERRYRHIYVKVVFNTTTKAHVNFQLNLTGEKKTVMWKSWMGLVLIALVAILVFTFVYLVFM